MTTCNVLFLCYAPLIVLNLVTADDCCVSENLQAGRSCYCCIILYFIRLLLNNNKEKSKSNAVREQRRTTHASEKQTV
jgi:hypothetical protein